MLSVAVKDGTPKKYDLEGLAVEIVAEWEELGRRLLDNNEAELYAIHHQNEKLPYCVACVVHRESSGCLWFYKF